MRLRLTILALGVLVATMPPSAGSAGPDASDPPRVGGPLIGSPFGCDDNGDPGPGVSSFQACSWFYDLVPVETSPTNDFGAYWIQAEIDPAKGWCAKEIIFSFEQPSGLRVLTASPQRSTKIKKRQTSIRSLVVDGAGAAPVPGTIEQDMLESPGRETVKFTGDVYRYRWNGNSSKKVVISIGLQLAYERIPPTLISTWAEGIGATMGSCKTPVVYGTG